MIFLNGEKKTYSCPVALADVLRQEGYEGKPVAIARNGEFVPRAVYAATALEENDSLEILAAMQGG